MFSDRREGSYPSAEQSSSFSATEKDLEPGRATVRELKELLARKCLDWAKAADLLESIASPQLLMEIYQSLFKARPRGSYGKDEYDFNDSKNSAPFIDVLIECLSQSPEGFSFLQDQVAKEHYPKAMEDRFGANNGLHPMDRAQATILHQMIVVDPKAAQDFNQELLLQLAEKSQNQLQDYEQRQHTEQAEAKALNEKLGFAPDYDPLELEEKQDLIEKQKQQFQQQLQHLKSLFGGKPKPEAPYQKQIDKDAENVLWLEQFPQSKKEIIKYFQPGENSRASIDILIKYLKTDPFAPLYIADLMTVLDSRLNKEETDYATDRLLESIKDLNLAEEMRRLITNLLYRLEFKETGILENRNLAPDQKKAIFEQYNQLTEQALTLAVKIKNSQLFKDLTIDYETAQIFMEQCAEAVMRRAKDMFNVVQAVANHGEARAQFYQRGELKCQDLQEVIEAMAIYSQIIEKFNCLLEPNQPDNRYSFSLTENGIDESQIPFCYHFAVIDQKTGLSSYLMIQLRPEGAPLGEHNAKREFNGEARINFLFFSEPISADIGEQSRQQALSFRIDREGIERANGEIVKNDPMMEKGEVSVEIGFIEEETQALPGHIAAKVAAIGNALDYERQRTKKEAWSQFYHNRDSINKFFGQAEKFAQLVKFIQKQIKASFVH